MNVKAAAKLSVFHTKAIYIIVGMKTAVSFVILVSTKSRGFDELYKLGICDIWKYIKFLWIET